MENLLIYFLFVYFCYFYWVIIWSNLLLLIICWLNLIWFEYFCKIEKKFLNFSCIYVCMCVCGIYMFFENFCFILCFCIVYNEVVVCVYFYWIFCFFSVDILCFILVCNYFVVKRKCNIWSFEEEGYKDL